MTEQKKKLGRPLSTKHGKCHPVHVSIPIELHEAAAEVAEKKGYLGYSRVYQDALLAYLKREKRRAG